MGNLTPEQMVDLKQHPITDLDSDFVDQCRQQYQQSGLCLIHEFLAPDALSVLAAEAISVADQAWFCNNSHSAWLTKPDDALSSQHVRHMPQQTFVGSVPYDRIGYDSHLSRLYQWDSLMKFVERVLGKQTLYRLADPLGACSVNVFVDGGAHGWHFDESEFTITIMLQSAEQGGDFEYVPLIRGLRNEESIVEDILSDRHDNISKLKFEAGALLIFGGNRTIHRVTKVSGSKPRLVPVLCFSDKPDQINSDSVRELFWGRVE